MTTNEVISILENKAFHGSISSSKKVTALAEQKNHSIDAHHEKECWI
jgi:hypothetical protein